MECKRSIFFVSLVTDRFLLAHLHLEMLSEQNTRRAVRTKAENLPSGLYDTYDDVIERISQQCQPNADLAFKVLSWVTYARRPLKPEELQCAVAITNGMTSLDDDDLTDVEDLLSFCAGIVIIDRESEVVRLVHYTTQGFLEDLLTDRKVDVPRACLSYLEVPSYSIGVNVDKLYPLLDYARMYWADHIRGHSEDQLKTDCLRAVSGHGIRVLLSDLCRYREIPTFNGQDIIQLLPICAAYGLAGFCRELLGSDKYVPLQES
jgi:hypothetical protein